MPTFAEWEAQRKAQGGQSVPPTPDVPAADDGVFKPDLHASWLSDSARYAGSELKGFAHSPVDALKGLLGLPKAVVSGAGELIKDPSLLLEAPRAAMDVLERPEELGSMLGQTVIGKAAAGGPGSGPGAAGAARFLAEKTPPVVGRTVSAVGRGMESTGKSGPVRTLGALGGLAEMLHGNLKGTLLSVVPPALEYGGKAVQRIGDKIGNTDVLQGLSKAVQAVTPGEQFTEPTAADSMRTTVETARDLKGRGISREQANQRAGYGVESTEQPGYHLPSEHNDFNFDKPAPKVRDRFTDILGPEGPKGGFDMGGTRYEPNASGSHTASYKPPMKSSALEGLQLATKMAKDFGVDVNDLSPDMLDSRINGLDRRSAVGESPTGAERRGVPINPDEPITGSIAERIARMRNENPEIDKQGVQMRKRSEGVKRHERVR